MNMSLLPFLPKSLLFNLFYTHFSVLTQRIVNSIINIYIWVICTMLVSGYVMQSFGLARSFGNFQFASIIGTIGLFQVYRHVVKNIIDFEGDRIICYYLTLPTKAYTVFLSMLFAYTCFGLLLSFMVLPLANIVLYNTFSFSSVSWIQFLATIVIANIFFAALGLASSAYIQSIAYIDNAWSRLIYPLWFLGGFQFSWASLYTLSPTFAYVVLCNPVIYVMEGMRASMLGQAGYFSWWICMVAIAFFTIGCWVYAYYRMKRFLDFV